MPFVSALALLFIALKLTGVIDWPWVGVLAPLWMTLVVALLYVIAAVGWSVWRDR